MLCVVQVEKNNNQSSTSSDGIFISRIGEGGPGDLKGLKVYDRIMKVGLSSAAVLGIVFSRVPVLVGLTHTCTYVYKSVLSSPCHVVCVCVCGGGGGGGERVGGCVRACVRICSFVRSFV